MEKIFIRERLNVVDYDNNNQGLIFSTQDVDIEGGAVNVEIEADVGGWYELTFDMPSFIYRDGEKIDNPMLANLFPLAKIQYTKVTRFGDEEEEQILYFIVQPQVGTRDDDGIVLQNFTCVDYPRHNLSKAKVGLTIGDDTIDEELSLTPNNELPTSATVFWIPADVQYRTDFNTIAEMAAWADAQPGAFAYIQSTGTAYRLTAASPANYTEDAQGNRTYTSWTELAYEETYTMDGDNPIPDPVWCPDWGGYPLAPDPNEYEYGDIDINDIDEISVQFYWDVVWLDVEKTYGRYDGTLYEEGSRLVYAIYQTRDYEFPSNFLGTYSKAENLDKLVAQTIEGTPATAYVLETLSVWQYVDDQWEDTYKTQAEYFKVKDILAGTWSKLDPQLAYLTPNNAENLLTYILRGSGWSVGTVDTILVSNGTVEMDETGVVSAGEEELRTYLTVDNSNAYNAISELCDVFMVYPRFDHINKTVSLQSNPGLDYGLEFKWRENLAATTVTQDGEKAVTKLWVYGGEDLISQQVISDCNRMNPNYYLAEYSSLEDLYERANPFEGAYAKLADTYTWAELCPNGWTTVDSTADLPATGSLGDTYYVTDEVSFWTWNPVAEAWFDTYLSNEPSDETTEVELEERYDYENGQWVNKGQFYHWYENVSPFADNYIMDFRYFLELGLITEEQVEDIKQNYVLPMSRIGRKRWPLYEEYLNLSEDYSAAANSYDASEICRDAVEEALKTTYSIRQYDDNSLITILEANVKMYPPGADISSVGEVANVGWTKTEIIYSEASSYPTAQTYDDIANVVPNPTVGSVVRVTDEAAVYYYNQFINFDDTISAYIGWGTSAQVDAVGFDEKENTLLYSPDGRTEAAIRGLGYFDEFRDELSKSDRPSLAPWYNPPMNEEDLPDGGEVDPTETSLKNNYYSALQRYVTEQMAMDLALERMMAIETELTINLEKQELLLAKIDAINAELREKYGDFIVEGTFTDEDIVYRYNLWYAGLEALELYHRPLVTYELEVTDISGLPEYRTVTEDVYHDIVYLMSRPELVLPEPGDYCYITDNTLGLVQEQANVTSVVRNLSNPSKNQVTIATVDTNTEDLIGKLVTAANTIYSKQQIYNRSSVITEDGTISTDSLVSSMEDSSGSLTLSSNSGTVIFSENGITTVDRDNGDYRMQYTGKGIFASTNAGVTWKNIVSAGQISINNLSAGTIDSNVITVTNIGHTAAITIDGSGITARRYGGAVSNPTVQVADSDVSFFLDASTGNAYFRGMIQAASGDIAGWNISEDALYKDNVGMNSNSSAYNGWAFWAGSSTPASARFRVDHSGNLYATSATIEGTVTANSGSIGNWTISGGALTNGNATIGSDGSITIGNYFRVTSDGSLTASNATITGTIYANDGTFTGEISASDITGGTITGATISGGTITVGSNFSVSSSGAIVATSGRIGPWYINSNGFYNSAQTSFMYTDGRLQFTPDSGGRLNIGNNGILLQGAGTGNKVVISDAALDIDQFASTQSGSINMSASNGSIRIACNDAISILGGRGEGATADAVDNQVYIVGTNSGNGTSKSLSAVMLYSPSGSIRLNAGYSTVINAVQQIVLTTDNSSIYISPPDDGWVYFDYGDNGLFGFNCNMMRRMNSMFGDLNDSQINVLKYLSGWS